MLPVIGLEKSRPMSSATYRLSGLICSGDSASIANWKELRLRISLNTLLRGMWDLKYQMYERPNGRGTFQSSNKSTPLAAHVQGE